MSAKVILRAQNLRKIYQMDGLEVRALDGVSLEIFQGEFVAIVGKSGSGKSTLMHIIGCLDRPTSGQLFLDDQEISQLNASQLSKIRNLKIGFVFQAYNLLARTTALDNVCLPLVYAGFGRHAREERGREMLKLVGLADRMAHLPNQLSGGQQQRVAIARALVTRPSIILADEPTGNLDSRSGEEIIALLHNLHQQGNTIVIVTHDEDLARQAKRIIRLEDGQIV